MEFNFAVDRAKTDKRAVGRGEDAPALSEKGVLVVCDGTGATGLNIHTYNGEEYTSAYLGSRKTSELAGDFIRENYERMMDSVSSPEELAGIVTELGYAIRDGLCSFVKENNFTLKIRGKCFRMLPTTLAAAVYRVYDDRIDVIALSAGDSRVLFWEPEKGLMQLSRDDVDDSCDAFSDTSNTNNCICADRPFRINYLVHSIPVTRGILFACSDGFTDPVKPFDQERCLIQWVGNCDFILDEEKTEIEEKMGSSLDSMGFTKKDDCSVAGVIFGYESDSGIKDSMRERFRYIVETFSGPYRDYTRLYREAVEEEKTAGEARKAYIEATDSVIKEKLFESLPVLLPSAQDYNSIYDFLAGQPCVREEIVKIFNENEEKKKALENREKEAVKRFLEFYRHFCFFAARCGDNVELPLAVMGQINNYVYYEEERRRVYELYNRYLSEIKELPELSPGTKEPSSTERLELLAMEFNTFAGKIRHIDRNFFAAERGVNHYFTVENPEIMRIYELCRTKGFSRIDKFIERIGKRAYTIRDDALRKRFIAEYEAVRREKEEFAAFYDSVTAAGGSFSGISDEERLRRYRGVVSRNLGGIMNAIKDNPEVFRFFSGEERTAYEEKLRELDGAASESRRCSELKTALWIQYKPVYEMFAQVKQLYVCVPQKGEV